ncbi:Proton-coupled folate transporter like protein [Argiope bruennichi]|uniref:Proton-coupled folate transporter like protein n=1 Tax=Argiope bruennichi TaxID=94029 RepID=A0A8T0E1U0_ARGBR|nr:Proton-coupled folate transporter like protein [Argiope bruennichi]
MSSKNESEKTRSSGEEKTQTEFSNQKENPVPKMMRVYIYVSDNACSILSEIKQMKIELVMFLYMFANMMIMVTLTSLIMEKVCLVHLGESEDVCSNLKDNLKTKTKVEKQASNYSVGISLVQMIPSSILACFIGAWSDRYSRKIPLIMALIGTTINGLGSTLLAAVFYSRAEFLFIPSTFAGISGGMVTVMTVLYSFASDTTTFGKRTIKYAFLEFAFGLAMPLGQLAGGWLFQWFGYIPETKGLDNKDSWIVKLRNLWSVQPVLESIRATIKPRPNKGRLQILLLILAMSLAVLSYASTGNINFIYCHHLRYKTEDPILGIVGSSSLLIKNVAMGLAHKEEFYLLANLFGLLSGLATLAGRSRISKVTSKDDIGKVFSFVTTAESILPILSTVVATQIFTATIDFYPGLVYLGLGGILILPLVIFSWISRLPIINYEQMHNESEDKVLSGDPCMETETAQSSNVEDGNELELKSNV